MTVLANKDLIMEISALISKLSKTKQRELIALIRKFVKGEEQNNQLKLVEEEKIILTQEEYENFIKACFFEKWEISKEDLSFVKEIQDIEIRN